jgi:hypothetical protein
VLHCRALRRALAPIAVAVSVAAAALVSPAGATAPDGRSYAYGARTQAPKITWKKGQVPAGFTGGPITAADGETVTVFAQDELLAADPSTNQHWADVLAGLLHGPELSKVTLYVAMLDRVGRICGSNALGCYSPSSASIVALGQDIRGVTAQSVVTHEYGHHIANNRANDPWPAIEWGTKRWASYENVCAKSLTGELVPGDEGQFYPLNPGEELAEDYRVLNERRAGLPESQWEVVAPSLYPDQAALDLLAQDVTTPWTANTTTTYRAVLGPGASGRGFRLATPLDGDFTATLTSPAKAKLSLRLVDLTTGKVLASAPAALRVKSVKVSVCGQRTLQVQVKRVSGAGAFTLAVSKP